MTNIRVVQKDEETSTESSFADACRAQLEKFLATGVNTLLFVGEREVKDGKSILEIKSVPDSYSLVRGLVLRLAETLDVYHTPAIPLGE